METNPKKGSSIFTDENAAKRLNKIFNDALKRGRGEKVENTEDTLEDPDFKRAKDRTKELGSILDLVSSAFSAGNKDEALKKLYEAKARAKAIKASVKKWDGEVPESKENKALKKLKKVVEDKNGSLMAFVVNPEEESLIVCINGDARDFIPALAATFSENQNLREMVTEALQISNKIK